MGYARKSWMMRSDSIAVILGNAHLPRPFSAEQIMSMPVFVEPPRRLWTAEEFYAVRDAAPASLRHELVDGELLVTPAPARRHQSIVVHLSALLHAYVRANGLGELLVAPFDVKLDKSVILQPDLLVIPPEVPYVARMAEVSQLSLAVEVLSPGSARFDRVTKRVAYLRHGIPEYWIIDEASRTVERWRPGDERPEIVSEQLVWLAPAGVEPFTLNLAAFFAEIPGVLKSEF